MSNSFKLMFTGFKEFRLHRYPKSFWCLFIRNKHMLWRTSIHVFSVIYRKKFRIFTFTMLMRWLYRNIYPIQNWINKLFSEEYRSPEWSLKPERWQGPATYKQNKTVSNCVVLSGQFVYLVLTSQEKGTQFVHLVCLCLKPQWRTISTD